MNCHTEKEHWTLARLNHTSNVPYMDFNLLVLISFEVTTMTTMNSQEPMDFSRAHGFSRAPLLLQYHLLGFLTK